MIPTVDQTENVVKLLHTISLVSQPFGYFAPLVWCNQIVVRPSLFPDKRNNTYLLSSVIPFKVVCLGPYTSSSGAEPPLIGSFGLLNDRFPLCSILGTGYPIFDLHLTKVLYDVVLPSILGSSSWSHG